MFSIQASCSGDDLLLLVSVRHGLQLLLLPLLQLRHHSSLLIPQLSASAQNRMDHHVLILIKY